MDIFAEQNVTRTSTTSDLIKKIALILGDIILIVAIFLASSMFRLLGVGLLLIFGLIYFSTILFKNFYVEYEYIITNGEVDIDKILAKSSRKRLLTVEASDFDDFGLLENAPEAKDGSTTVLAAGEGDGTDYYADFQHKSYGSVRLIFSPNERIIGSITPYLKAELKRKFK